MADPYKRSKVNLWDELQAKKFNVTQSQVKTLIDVPDYMDLNNKLALSSRTDNPLYESLDVGKDLYDLKQKDIQQDATTGLVQADVVALQGALATVQADVLTNQGQIADANVDLLALQTSDATQNTRLDGVESVNSSQATSISQEIADRLAGDANLQSQLDALGVQDTATLAQINQIITDYNNADTSILTQQTLLESRVSALEATVANLTL